MGHVMRTVVQCVWDIAQGALTTPYKLTAATDLPSSWTGENLNIGWLLSQGWDKRFQGLFHEYKIHKVTAHFMPYANTTQTGEYCFTLWDSNENTMPSTFTEAVGSPASVVRKTYQPAKLVWYPTEPEDRDWHTFGDKHPWVSSSLHAAETLYKAPAPDAPAKHDKDFIISESADISGKVIIETELSARGKPKTPTIPRCVPSDRVDEYIEMITTCLCVKCLRIARVKRAQERLSTQFITTALNSTKLGSQTDPGSTSGASSPFEDLM